MTTKDMDLDCYWANLRNWDEINHFLDWCDLAIKNWPNIVTNYNIVETKKWDNDFNEKMWEVKAHYENGGDIFNRP